jgi:hypothetical protein
VSHLQQHEKKKETAGELNKLTPLIPALYRKNFIHRQGQKASGSAVEKTNPMW